MSSPHKAAGFAKTVTVDGYYDDASMTTAIQAQLSAGLVEQQRQHTVEYLASLGGMDTQTFVDFIRFLSDDSELRDRFLAYRTMQRLTK